MNQPRKDTNRIDKVNSLIQHELGFIVKEFTEDLAPLVTITKVETSRDMKWAKIWVSILGGEQPIKVKNPKPVDIANGQKPPAVQTLDDKVLERMKRDIYDIQGELNKHFHTKIIPRLQFFLDTSPRYAQHISNLIEKLHEEE